MFLNRNQKIGISGMCLIFFGILLHFIIMPLEVRTHVKKKHALKRGMMMRDLWGRLPFSFDFNIHLFNISNPDEIAKGEKPHVHEIGPYVYDEWQEKTYQKDHDDDDTVSFKFRSTYYFNPEKSHGLTGEEELTVPNYFIFGLINTVLRAKPEALHLIEKAVESIFEDPKSLFIKARAREIIFDGILIDCTKKDFAAQLVCQEVHDRAKEFGLREVNRNIYKFSLWGSMNATDTKRIRVYRGFKNVMDVGKVVEYDKKPNISTWNDEYCDKFNGTDGTVFHPFFDKKGKDDLIIFSPVFCRNIVSRYDSKTKYSGLKLLRYTTDFGTDGAKNPLDRCYCETRSSCLKKGAFDMYKCNKLPIIITNPHFYLADSFYLNGIEGLDPDKDKHQSIIDLEPFSGTPVQAHMRLQTNMFVRKMEKFKYMSDYREALLPLFWVEESMVLPDFFIQDIKSGFKLLFLAKLFRDLIILSGFALCGFVGYKHFILYRAHLAEKKRRQVKKQNSVDGNKTNAQPPTAEESRENAINDIITAANNISIPINNNSNNPNRIVERLPPISAYASRPNTVPPGVV